MDENQPISEQYRLAAKAWVQADAAASLLESTKSATLSQMMMKWPELAINRAEMQVKASAEWMEVVKSMVKAREEANLFKVKMEWLRMKFNEWQSDAANKRAEQRL